MTIPPARSKLVVKRGGSTTTKLVPLPTVLVDTRERLCYTFHDFYNWIGGTQSRPGTVSWSITVATAPFPMSSRPAI